MPETGQQRPEIARRKEQKVNLSDHILQAVGPDRRHVALTIRAEYQPAGGAGRTVMPPTYPVSEREKNPSKAYLIGPRLVGGERRDTVVLDQEPSQANRVEQALLLARDDGRLTLPVFEMVVPSAYGRIRLTSLDFPHRYADAYLRDSAIDGVKFDDSAFGKRLREATSGDVRPLYEREPLSLVLGAWDSHRKGRWPRFPRLYSASMFGLDPVTGLRQGGRMCPVNLTGSVDNTKAAKAGEPWKFVPLKDGDKAKEGHKLSEIGHGNIAPNPVHGGVTVTSIDRTATISCAGLDRLRFGAGTPAEAAVRGRATLAALALAGDRLAFGRPSVWLRSGCDLGKAAESIGLELPGGEIEELPVTAQEALDAYDELRERAAAAGLVMAGDTVTITPYGELAKAIQFAIEAGSQEDQEAVVA
jgi:CRISPR-associated protein Csb1